MIEFCNANQGFIMVILTAVYVVATSIIAWGGYKSNRIAHKNNENLQKLEQERFRPYIFCEFFLYQTLISFSISNSGLTVAKNITVSFDKNLFRLVNNYPNSKEEPKREPVALLNNPIGSIAPGQKIDSLLGYFSDFINVYPGCKIECTVSYESVYENPYTETFLLDVSYEKTNRCIRQKTISDVASSLDKLEQTFRLFVTGHHKPRILTQNIKQYQEELEKHFEEQQNSTKTTNEDACPS